MGACSSPKQIDRVSGNGSGSSGSGSGGSGIIDLDGGAINCDPSDPTSPCVTAPPPPGCGDGILTEDEACDDANKVSGDGCGANCLFVEPGYSCNPPGQPCHEIAKCGDGIVSLSEPCDDGNVNPGDGCSVRCKLEIGFKCEGQPSVCTPTTCGDGILEGAESCEDGNAVPFDGCSSLCQTEPDCSGGACVSACGDGLVLDEECDDANTVDGDGCSSTCTIEEGFECSVDLGCEMLNGACILRVPVVYRDFDSTHEDFEVTCKGAMNGEVAHTGLVADELVGGKPAPAGAGAGEDGGCITALDQWYSDSGSPAIVGDIMLFDNGNGGFVNRYGANGEQWTVMQGRWCGNEGDFASMCMPSPPQFSGCNAPAFDPAIDQCLYPCPEAYGAGNAVCAARPKLLEDGSPEVYDGTPLFFPLDGLTTSDMRYVAKVPPQYGYPWPEDSKFVQGAMPHNFHFTTEVVYWFKYDAATPATLDFTGDDDVWVFVNGHLAVDLGGVHQPVDGSVTLSPATEGTYGLEDGKVYQIKIFHAERKIESSSFRLTLSGFKTNRSECVPVCGDGIVGLGEQCDDGINDGGYGECAPGCLLGEYCGDGIVQEGEDCDDGNTLEGDQCGSACRIIVVR